MTRGTSARYVRGLGAALIAVTALLLAANAGPARAGDDGTTTVHQVDDTGVSGVPGVSGVSATGR
ncbi:hypothetical protein [Streptomyces sp. NBC_00670]|jgi:hypothetical protein|uniref:hypothetical protein n=1 Tax=Streptomyces sp. NBC_00670 TaxID=2975804 RepID=UPI002E30EFE9|nr:hypothetical protein [Streptomyces sp. NBC_00670]